MHVAVVDTSRGDARNGYVIANVIVAESTDGAPAGYRFEAVPYGKRVTTRWKWLPTGWVEPTIANMSPGAR